MRLRSSCSLGVLASAAVVLAACGGDDASQASSTTGGATGGATGASSSSTSTSSSSSSTSSSSTSSSSGAGGAAGYPAAHAPAPQVSEGPGSVLANPNFIPVFFAGDDTTIESEVEDFLGKLGTSTYWSTVTSEYGVGPATAGAAVILAQAAPTTLDASTLPAWINAQLAATPPTLPTPDANTMYVLHYPASTTITLSSPSQGTNTSCVNFGGFHDTGTLADNSPIAYAVIPRCAALGTLTGIDEITVAESHELAEAATDPSPTQTLAAYAQPDEADLFWELGLGGGEVGDLCAQNPGAFYLDTALGYTVQRIWSNRAAAASLDPCIPAPQGEVYFNAVPNVTATIPLLGIDMHGVTVAVGKSATVEVDSLQRRRHLRAHRRRGARRRHAHGPAHRAEVLVGQDQRRERGQAPPHHHGGGGGRFRGERLRHRVPGRLRDQPLGRPRRQLKMCPGKRRERREAREVDRGILSDFEGDRPTIRGASSFPGHILTPAQDLAGSPVGMVNAFTESYPCLYAPCAGSVAPRS